MSDLIMHFSTKDAEGQVMQDLFPLHKSLALGMFLWVFLVFTQALLWASTSDFIASSLLLIGGVSGSTYTLRRHILRSAPISTMMIFGYTTYYFLLPPIATLAEWKPLTNNLDHPILVQEHALIGLASLILSHAIYRSVRSLQYLRKIVTEKLYRPLGYFSSVTNMQLVIMGLIGLTAMSYQVFVAGANQQDAQGASNKFIQALYPLAYLPFCIILKNITTAEVKINPRWLLVLAGYTVLLLAISMARNARSAFLLGIMSIVICFGYGLAAGLISRNIVKIKVVVPLLVLALILLGPVADLATSMVIVRGQRSDIPPMQLLEETIETYGDKQAIRDRRLDDRTIQSDWDESYIDNLFMARLSNLKFTDNSIDLALRMDESARANIRDLELQRGLAVFPRPVLNFIAPWVDKDFIGTASGGDLMLYTVTQDSSVLGGFRTGSLLGNAYALFGWLYPIVLAIPLLPLFALADAQTTTIHHGFRRQPRLAPLAAATFFSWFFYLTSAATGTESFSTLFAYLFRGWLQVVLIYALVYQVARLASRIKLGE